MTAHRDEQDPCSGQWALKGEVERLRGQEVERTLANNKVADEPFVRQE